jgi:hypothetical protein
MSVGVRLQELQSAMDKYGKESVESYRQVHAVGDAIVKGFAEYLGEGSEVIGVPPFGEWKPHQGDYHDAKFSTYYEGIIRIAPVEMGLAIRIPHSGDGGELWLR